MKARKERSALAVVVVLLAGSCSKNDIPGSPSPEQCRTYASEFTRQVARPEFTSPQETSRCTFDMATSTRTCTGPYTLRAGCSGTLSSADQWGSLSDFVTEKDTVGRLLQTEERETVNYSPSCGGAGTATVKFAYDSSRRLTSRSVTAPTGGWVNVAYSSWDARARPTAGTATSSDNPTGCRLTASYDEGRRTSQTTVRCADGTGVELVSLDANGNIVRIQNSKNGTVTSTETRTIGSTQSVCR